MTAGGTEGYVYVLALEQGKFYVGHTNDLYRRICQHFSGMKAPDWYLQAKDYLAWKASQSRAEEEETDTKDAQPESA